ncbi:MAG: hypothetical protein IPM29_09175 [Planctomycetes bacterium]|nr:hypothetical protein [Planctomycetota bacterium]
MSHLATRVARAAVLLGALLPSACSSGPVAVPSGVPPVEVAIPPGAPPRESTRYNLADDLPLALSGYDPVSYFPEGGSRPTPGDPDLSARFGGVIYLFATREHRDLFLADPLHYEPAHGGWCSYAMARGQQASCDPTAFLIEDGRLLLFHRDLFSDTRDGFTKQDLDAADRQWEQLTGEPPRR